MATSAITLQLDPQMQSTLEKLVDLRHQEPEAILREAIAEYLEREAGAEEAFRNRALASWEHYQRTGLHLTHEEVGAWLEKLANGEDAPRPQCHT